MEAIRFSWYLIEQIFIEEEFLPLVIEDWASC
jgi:hypothetical protein